MQVEKVYLLVRGKKTQTAQQRVEKMLCGGLFWMLHKQVAAGADSPFQKVVAVEGDLCNPGLGLSQADRQQLLGGVDHVIHCAASIELDADIHYTLRWGTATLPGELLPSACHTHVCMKTRLERHHGSWLACCPEGVSQTMPLLPYCSSAALLLLHALQALTS